MLDSAKGGFPVFTGKPNPNLPLRRKPPERYDSSKSKAQIDWVETGPVRATVRAQHQWRHFKFETRVTLTAGLPYVEVLTRMLAFVPPKPDVRPADIQEGYWLSLALKFRPTSVIRDFPLAVEPTKNTEFHALTFVDLVGKDRGLLVLHPGTQWFRRDERGVFSNLIMREWESYFDWPIRECGWPIYAEYRHALLPHAAEFTNADRLRAAGAMSQPLLARLGPLRAGELPGTKRFVTVKPAAVQLAALRRKTRGAIELRLSEIEGRHWSASVELSLPLVSAYETNLLGAKVADVAREESRLRFPIDPWKIRTFELDI